MATTPITGDQFAELLHSTRREAFRLELQPEYREPAEADLVARWLAGDRSDPTDHPAARSWFAGVKTLTEHGGRMLRVRVHDVPPTNYQRWERWLGRWNVAAGEEIRYLTRPDAQRVGLLPAAGDADWWLIDDRTLILMRFSDGTRVTTEKTTDLAQLAWARALRDLAIEHSAPDTPQSAAAA
jgi:hypothetical protein